MKRIQLFLFFAMQIFNSSSQGWFAVGTGGPPSWVHSLYEYNSVLYAGGVFVNGDGSRDVIKWNGTTWTGADKYVSNTVFCLLEYNTELISGGNWSAFVPDPTLIGQISSYNLSSWSPLGLGIGDTISPSSVYALAKYGIELYAAGGFGKADGLPVNNIAKWNGLNWSDVGGGFNLSGGICRTLCEYSGELYAGGHFTTAGGVTVNRIARWNGSTWSVVGSGLGANNTVRTLEVYNSELYAAGDFDLMDGLAVNKIAKWNGTNWSVVGSGMDAVIYDLCVHNSELYACGSFIIAGGISANRVAKWNGTNWMALGSGMNNSVFCLGEYGSDLFAGGIFTVAGATVANGVARLDPATDINENISESCFEIFPNPTTDLLSIENGIGLSYFITDESGKFISNGKYSSPIEISKFSRGIYLIHITDMNSKTQVSRFIMK